MRKHYAILVIGCNRLECEWFKGVNKCENYINAYEEKRTNDYQTSLPNFN